jgi:hypothetical protein
MSLNTILLSPAHFNCLDSSLMLYSSGISQETVKNERLTNMQKNRIRERETGVVQNTPMPFDNEKKRLCTPLPQARKNMPMQIPVPSLLPCFLPFRSMPVLLPTLRAQSRHPHYHDHNPCRHLPHAPPHCSHHPLSNMGLNKHPLTPPLDELIQHKTHISEHKATDIKPEELGRMAG